MFGIGSREMIILLVIVLIIFGPTKLPQLARAIGKSMRELKDGLSESASGNDKRTPEDKEWERKHASAASDAQPVAREEKAKTV